MFYEVSEVGKNAGNYLPLVRAFMFKTIYICSAVSLKITPKINGHLLIDPKLQICDILIQN